MAGLAAPAGAVLALSARPASARPVAPAATVNAWPAKAQPARLVPKRGFVVALAQAGRRLARVTASGLVGVRSARRRRQAPATRAAALLRARPA